MDKDATMLYGLEEIIINEKWRKYLSKQRKKVTNLVVINMRKSDFVALESCPIITVSNGAFIVVVKTYTSQGTMRSSEMSSKRANI